MENQKQNKKLIWLDCDPGHDDYLAMVIAANHPDIELVGISTTFGNTDIEHTTKNTLGILELMKIHSVDVYKGQDHPIRVTHQIQDGYHGPGGLCMKLPETLMEPIEGENVYQRIFNKFQRIYEEKKQKIILVGLAGHTNIALLFQKFPKVIDYIDYFVGMYGGIKKGNSTPVAEANAYNDPEATDIVLKSNIKHIMCPLDLEAYLSLPPDFVDRIKTLKNSKFIELTLEDIDFMYKKCKYYETYDLENRKELKAKMCQIYDLSAIFYVIADYQFETHFWNVEMETQSKLTEGQTVVDRTGISQRKPNVHVAMKCNNEALYNCLFECIERCNNRCLEFSKQVESQLNFTQM